MSDQKIQDSITAPSYLDLKAMHADACGIRDGFFTEGAKTGQYTLWNNYAEALERRMRDRIIIAHNHNEP